MGGWKDYELEQFGKKAEECGICNQDLFYRALRMCKDKEQSIKLYKRCIDWCLEAQYPDLDFLRSEYTGQDIQDLGMFIDHRFNDELLDKQQVYIFHNCTGTIRVALNVEDKIIPMLYFANGCNMTVECTQSNAFPIRVPLYIFGDNTVIAKDNNNAVYRRYTSKIIGK